MCTHTVYTNVNNSKHSWTVSLKLHSVFGICTSKLNKVIVFKWQEVQNLHTCDQWLHEVNIRGRLQFVERFILRHNTGRMPYMWFLFVAWWLSKHLDHINFILIHQIAVVIQYFIQEQTDQLTIMANREERRQTDLNLPNVVFHQ